MTATECREPEHSIPRHAEVLECASPPNLVKAVDIAFVSLTSDLGDGRLSEEAHRWRMSSQLPSVAKSVASSSTDPLVLVASVAHSAVRLQRHRTRAGL